MDCESNKTWSEYIHLFCQNSSLRGVGRLTRPNYSSWLRILWMLFIGSMIAALISSTIVITNEYLAYNIIVQTNVEDTSSSPFPALTICGTHPFSKDAVDHWSSGRILSPNQFNRNLRHIAKEYFDTNNFHLASNLFYYDHVGIYYQNLTVQESYDLSYKPETFLMYCNLLLKSGGQVLNSNFSECFLDVTHFSHPKYFNCFSMTVNKTFLNEVKHLNIIIHLGDQDDPSLHPAAFIQDVFDQANGLRIVLHEPQLRPDVENDGIHVDAGSKTEIIYQLEEWREANTPEHQCIQKNEEFLLTDLEDTFGYDSKTCVDRKVNELIAKRCSCQLSYLPRPLMPSEAMPYCGQISYAKIENLIDRLTCVGQMNLTQMRNDISKIHCKDRCNFHRYLTRYSNTKWKATSWQLHWLVKISEAYRNLDDNGNSSKETNFTKDIKEYFAVENLQSRSSNIFAKGLNQYSYITIRNTADKTFIKQEVVQLTLSALFSRLGGLSSLYLGLTCSFVIEVIEFLVLSKKTAKSSKKKKVTAETLL